MNVNDHLSMHPSMHHEFVENHYVCASHLPFTCIFFIIILYKNKTQSAAAESLQLLLCIVCIAMYFFGQFFSSFYLMLQFCVAVLVEAVSLSRPQYLKSDKTYFLTIWCSLMVPWLLLCLSLCPGIPKQIHLCPLHLVKGLMLTSNRIVASDILKHPSWCSVRTEFSQLHTIQDSLSL